MSGPSPATAPASAPAAAPSASAPSPARPGEDNSWYGVALWIFGLTCCVWLAIGVLRMGSKSPHFIWSVIGAFSLLALGMVWHSGLRYCYQRASAVPAEQAAVRAIEALPVHEFVADEEAGALECCLCLDPVVNGAILRTLPCAHAFHKACIDRWLLDAQAGRERNCPLCKADPLQPPATSTPAPAALPAEDGAAAGPSWLRALARFASRERR